MEGKGNVVVVMLTAQSGCGKVKEEFVYRKSCSINCEYPDSSIEIDRIIGTMYGK